MCSLQLETNIEWEVMSSPLDSDHCPIMLNMYERLNEEKFNFLRANWQAYSSHSIWKNLPSIDGRTSEGMLEDLDGMLKCAS